MNLKLQNLTQKKEIGHHAVAKSKKQSRVALKESLLGEGNQDCSVAIFEGGGNDCKGKSSTPEINEVDRVEVVKDLGFSSTMTTFVFMYIFFIDVLINLDHGAIPAGLSDIQAELGMDETKMGVMGSMVFFGLFMGSITASFIMYIFEHKTIIWLSLCLNGASLWLLTMKSNFYLMCFSRLITGFSQIFIAIYVPVFFDAYATTKSKSFMLSWILVMPPIGVVVGYAMTTYIILNGGLWAYPSGHYWYQSFRLQCFMNWGAAALAFMIPPKYVNITECVRLKRAFIEQRKGSGNMLPTAMEVDSSLTKDEQEVQRSNDSVDDTAQAKAFVPEDSVPVESAQISPIAKQPILNREKSSKESLKELFQNKPFIYLTLAITTLFFVISGVQMWATFYFVHALGIDATKASIYFGIVALTSPVTGAILSGYIIDYLGGFYAPIALPFCLIIGTIGILCAWLIPFTSNYALVIFYLWMLLFIGAMVLPICTGVALTKVEPEMRPRANSIANLFYNLLGYFPAPSVYGLAVYFSGQQNSGWGMGSLMFASSFMPIFIMLACFNDPTLNVNNMFQRIKSEPVQIQNEDNDKDNDNENDQEVKAQGSIGINQAQLYAINEPLQIQSQQIISNNVHQSDDYNQKS